MSPRATAFGMVVLLLTVPARADVAADIAAADAAFAASIGDVTPESAAAIWQGLRQFCLGEICRHDVVPHNRAWLVLMVHHISEGLQRATRAGGDSNEWMAGQYERALMNASKPRQP